MDFSDLEEVGSILLELGEEEEEEAEEAGNPFKTLLQELPGVDKDRDVRKWLCGMRVKRAQISKFTWRGHGYFQFHSHREASILNFKRERSGLFLPV